MNKVQTCKHFDILSICSLKTISILFFKLYTYIKHNKNFKLHRYLLDGHCEHVMLLIVMEKKNFKEFRQEKSYGLSFFMI